MSRGTFRKITSNINLIKNLSLHAYLLENTILEETKIENKRLLSLISEINQENNNLKQQLADKQNQYWNYEIKVKTEEINSQYLMNDIKILREENKRIQDLYNNLAVNFSKLVTMMEQNTFDKSKSTSWLIRFRKVADSCLGIIYQ